MKPSQIQRFQQQQDKFAAGVSDRVARIKMLWSQMATAVPADQSSREDMVLEAHKLAGTATTLGFIDLGEWGRDVETLIKSHQQNATVVHEDPELQRLMDSLDAVAKIEPKRADKLLSDEATLLHEQEQNHQLIYVVAEDMDSTQEMVDQLRFIDYKVNFYQDTATLKEALDKEAPSVIILDMDSDALLEDIKKVWRKSSGVPLVVLSNCSSWECRLHASRAGAYAFFQKPIEYDEILSVLDSLWESSHAKYRILIVEDDRVLVALCRYFAKCWHEHSHCRPPRTTARGTGRVFAGSGADGFVYANLLRGGSRECDTPTCQTHQRAHCLPFR